MNSNPMPRRNIPNIQATSKENLNRCSSYSGLCPSSQNHLVTSNPNLITSHPVSPNLNQRLSGQFCQKVSRTDLYSSSPDFELLRGADNITYLVNRSTGQVFTQQWVLNPRLIFIPMDRCIPPSSSSKMLIEGKSSSSIVRCFPFSPKSRRTKGVDDDLYQGLFQPNSPTLKHNVPLKSPDLTRSRNGTYDYVGNHLFNPKEFTTDISKLKGTLITVKKIKGPNGFGFTIIGGSENCREVFLQVSGIINSPKLETNNRATVIDGEKSNLQVGDIIVMCSNVLTLGATPAEFIALAQSTEEGQPLCMTVCRGYALPSLQRQQQQHLAALQTTGEVHERVPPITSSVESPITSASVDATSGIVVGDTVEHCEVGTQASHLNSISNKVANESLPITTKKDKILRLGFDPNGFDSSVNESPHELQNNELIMKLENIYSDMKPPTGQSRISNRGPIIRFHSKLPPKPTNSKHVNFNSEND